MGEERLSEEDRLVLQAYPELFGTGPWRPSETALAWGLMVGPGWRPIVLDLLEELSPIAAESPFRVAQVKEKFGGLRVYIHPRVDRAVEAIQAAEARADVTCELCGAPGKLRLEAHVQVRCDDCQERRQHRP